ncbi:MAG: RecX family transcriptional regulator [archaeon]|nr:RecX family transcriptional regulator [archaeon]
MVKKEWSEQDLLVKAQNYCSQAEHCVAEVREKLYQWGATAMVQDTIIQQLCQSGFIDERRYATAFVHDKVAFQGWGREKIRMMLQMKHLPSTIIEAALGEINETVYDQQIARLIEQKRQEGAADSAISNQQSKIKLARFLAQRGFTTDEIWRNIQ